MAKLTALEQARKNALKTVRTAIRLKYSLLADAEINDRLEEAGEAFDDLVNGQEFPDPITVLRALEGDNDGS